MVPAEVEFFLVIDSTINLHSNVSNCDDDSAIACHLTGKIDGLTARRLRGDKHRIGAVAIGVLQADIVELRRRSCHGVGSEAQCKFGSVAGYVHTDHMATRCLQHLHGELT